MAEQVCLAREHQACRVCGVPINHPPIYGIWWDGDDWPMRPGEGITVKDGDEFAHSQCVEMEQGV